MSPTPTPAHPPSPRTLVAGATGLVGRELVRLLADDPGSLVLLTRRPLPPGLAPEGATVIETASLAAPPPLPPLDVAVVALGTTMAQAGSEAAFRAVDLDAVVAVARAARAAGATRLGLVSALGADARSAVLYNRVKGEAEDAVAALGFDLVVVARPSLLDGHREALGQPFRRAESWALRLTRPIAPLIPAAWRPIQAHVVARALLRALAEPDAHGVHVLASGELQRVGAPQGARGEAAS